MEFTLTNLIIVNTVVIVVFIVGVFTGVAAATNIAIRSTSRKWIKNADSPFEFEIKGIKYKVIKTGDAKSCNYVFPFQHRYWRIRGVDGRS